MNFRLESALTSPSADEPWRTPFHNLRIPISFSLSLSPQYSAEISRQQSDRNEIYYGSYLLHPSFHAARLLFSNVQWIVRLSITPLPVFITPKYVLLERWVLLIEHFVVDFTDAIFFPFMVDAESPIT